MEQGTIYKKPDVLDSTSGLIRRIIEIFLSLSSAKLVSQLIFLLRFQFELKEFQLDNH